jgi:cbb3-type cytochrome oxidase subunit 1
MTVVWGIVGMLVGVIIAAQLLIPALNFDLPFLTYSRLRPLHTNAVIFAFGGSALFADLLLHRAAHLPHQAVPAGARAVHVLGLAARSSCWRR